MGRGVRTEQQTGVDASVGSRVRLRREAMGMSQGQLGDALGVSFQQVQKYENGANRISASTLLTLSKTLGVSPSFFFDDVFAPPENRWKSVPSSRETLMLVQTYYRLPWPLRHSLCQVMKSVATAAQTRAEATAIPRRRTKR
jgi:transcriptional regulator with XRE-family HTH domain